MWNLSLVMWYYTRLLIMKTDITKAFRCQQAISMGELCQKQSMDCSLWSWVISRWTLTLSSVQETTDEDVLIQILKFYYRLHPNEFR